MDLINSRGIVDGASTKAATDLDSDDSRGRRDATEPILVQTWGQRIGRLEQGDRRGGPPRSGHGDGLGGL